MMPVPLSPELFLTGHFTTVFMIIMRSGVKIRDLKMGDGAVAVRNSIAIAHIRGFLHRGEIRCDTYKFGTPTHVNLSKRNHVAGLIKGIEGMRVGGCRELIVSPHLAYGQKGAPPLIPPNAVIRFEVELLAVEMPNQHSEQCWPPGKQLVVFHPGEAARNMPRWQFGLIENESAGASIAFPIPGQTWRYVRQKNVEFQFEPIELAQILESVQETFNQHQSDCLTNDDLWADASEKANSITRDRHTNSLCVTFTIWEKGQILLDYSLPESSPILLNSLFYRAISEKLTSHLMCSNSSSTLA
jgi:hypothetical protein